MNSIENLISTLDSEIGYLEKRNNYMLDSKTANAGNKNYTKYARDLDSIQYYNGQKQGYSWCCVLPDWARVKCFGEETALKMVGQKKGGLGAGVKYMAQYYKAIGRWYTSNPQKGDQIVFGRKDKNGKVTSWLHTGIVEKVQNGRVYTIEGNTSAGSSVIANGGAVCRKSYLLTNPRILGYGRPMWELAEKQEKGEEADMTKDEVQKIVKEEVEKAVAELRPIVYKTAADIPAWAANTVESLINQGKLIGDQNGNLNLSQDTLRALVIMNR